MKKTALRVLCGAPFAIVFSPLLILLAVVALAVSMLDFAIVGDWHYPPERLR